MITAAEQYRALVAKLEAINPSQAISEAPLPYGTVAPAETPAETPAAAPAETPAAAPAPAVDANAELLKKIEHAPTFNQAYAMAKKAGLKKFKWCQCKEYAVKDAPSPVMPMPVTPPPPKPTQDFVTTNPMGDFDPTQFSGQAAAPRPRK